MKTIESTTINRDIRFTQRIWEDLVNNVATIVHLSPAQQVRFHESRTARLIGALPWLAGCRNPDRIALSHLMVYWLSVAPATNRIFDHRLSDNGQVLDRLRPIMNFEGGDNAILTRGMKLLALQMVCGYCRDLAKDAASGEYNPLLDRTWPGKELIESLVLDIQSVQCPDMDLIMTIEDAKNQWWNI
jgi:hypothetical protein